MANRASVYLLVALAASLFGFTEIASEAARISKVLFFLFLVALLLCEALPGRRRRVIVVRVRRPARG